MSETSKPDFKARILELSKATIQVYVEGVSDYPLTIKKVPISVFTEAERLSYKRMDDGNTRMDDGNRKAIIVTHAIEEFTEKDIFWIIDKMPAGILEDLYEKVTRFSGMDREMVHEVEAKKNS